MTIATLIAVAGTYFQQTVPAAITYPVLLREVGTLEVVRSPRDALITEVVVLPDEFVARGEVLLRLRDAPSTALSALRDEHLSASRELARLQASLASAYPPGIAPLDPNGAADALPHDPDQPLPPHADLRETIDAAEATAVQLEAEAAAAAKQLRATRRRLWHAESLLEQGVVYEDGVYTRALVDTLRQTTGRQRAEVARKRQAADRAAAEVREQEQELRRLEDQRSEALRFAVTQQQTRVADLQERIRREEAREQAFVVTAPSDGRIETLENSLAGTAVARGAPLLEFRAIGTRISGLLETGAAEAGVPLVVGTVGRARFATERPPSTQDFRAVVTALGAAGPGRSVAVGLELTPTATSTALRHLAPGSRGVFEVPLTPAERLAVLVGRATELLRRARARFLP